MRTIQTVIVSCLALGVAGALVACSGSVSIGKTPDGAMSASSVSAPPAPADGDKDGVTDDVDKCLDKAEDGKAPEPKDGCPTTDEDGDGIAGEADKCPTEPETKNGYEDEDGCPDEPEDAIAKVEGEKVKIKKKIMFDKGKATISAESADVIDAIAKVLTKHPELELLEVGGHASEEGDAGVNQRLTQQRVESVVKALVALGVDGKRLVAQGYGEYCPEKPEAKTEEEHELNRRVEFKVLIRSGTVTKAAEKRGCPAAEKAGIKPKAITPPAAAK